MKFITISKHDAYITPLEPFSPFSFLLLSSFVGCLQNILIYWFWVSQTSNLEIDEFQKKSTEIIIVCLFWDFFSPNEIWFIWHAPSTSFFQKSMTTGELIRSTMTLEVLPIPPNSDRKWHLLMAKHNEFISLVEYGDCLKRMLNTNAQHRCVDLLSTKDINVQLPPYITSCLNSMWRVAQKPMEYPAVRVDVSSLWESRELLHWHLQQALTSSTSLPTYSWKILPEKNWNHFTNSWWRLGIFEK